MIKVDVSSIFNSNDDNTGNNKDYDDNTILIIHN